MAQRDYVARGQKKKAPVKKKTNPNQPMPWFKLILAIAVIIAFAYGLWFLQQSSGTAPEPKAKTVEVLAPSEADKDPLPVLEEEEWSFIDDLPEYSVEVDTDTAQGSDQDYLMQCGSFRKRSQAEELKARIAFVGLSSQVRQSTGKNGLWYRVVLGPYESKRAAERDRHALKSQKINYCKIWFWNL